MKINFTILVLLLIAFCAGTEALKCYKDVTETEREVATCEKDQICMLVKPKRGAPRAFGCFIKETEKECQKNPSTCTVCKTDFCNALKCYSSKDKKPVVCDVGQICTTDGSTNERKCGQCESRGHDECRECNEDMCNKPLFCLDSANEEVQCKDVSDSDPPQKCITILNHGRAVDKGCGTCPKPKPEENLPQTESSVRKCEECDGDKCNTEPVKSLECYNYTNHLNKCGNPRDNCITILDHVSKRAVNKECSTCAKWRKTGMSHDKCEDCYENGCNKDPIIELMTCYNNTNEKEVCKTLHDYCYTRKKNYNGFALVQEKGCGQYDDGEYTPCFQDKCNNEILEDKLECYKVDDKLQKTVESCELHGQKCINADNKWIIGRGCGLCPTELPPDEICHLCNKSKCNDFQWPKCKAGAGNGAGDFFVEKECKQNLMRKLRDSNGDIYNKTCPRGYKCMLTHTKELRNQGVDKIQRECGLCPKTLSSEVLACSECNTPLCNDFKYPKCLAGAGNGAGDFYVKNECKNFLHLTGMNVTASCIKQQVEGITYKGCGSCGNFVDYAVTKIPSVPKDANINKCHECETSESGDPCNGGILAHHVPVLLFVFGACMPWLMLSMMSPFAGV